MVTIPKILVPIDLSEISREVVPYAVELAKKFGAKLELLHVGEDNLYADVACQFEGLPGLPRGPYFRRTMTDAPADSFTVSFCVRPPGQERSTCSTPVAAE